MSELYAELPEGFLKDFGIDLVVITPAPVVIRRRTTSPYLEFTATLPPNDPLFVAEFDPNLANLEKPQLMRQFGLIVQGARNVQDTRPPIALNSSAEDRRP
jgi:hypothetical protein